VTRIWLSALAVTVMTWLMKASGPVALGDRQLPPRFRSVIAMMAPALLAGLIVVELGGPGWSEVDGAQVAGVAAAGVARLLRAPMLVAVLAGVVVTATIRAL